MKSLIVLLTIAVSLLTGCVVEDRSFRDRNSYHDGYRERDRARYNRDRDGDGVRNSQDRRPDDSRRY